VDEETILRQKLVAEAETWLGTPYVSNGLVKGKRGGTDCAMLIIGIYRNVGLLPHGFDPRPYPPQWHLHQSEEKYLSYVVNYSDKVLGPPARVPKAGDLVLFKLGRVYSHGGMVLAWPTIIHAIGNAEVIPEDISKSTIGKRAFWPAEKLFFSPKFNLETNGNE